MTPLGLLSRFFSDAFSWLMIHQSGKKGINAGKERPWSSGDRREDGTCLEVHLRAAPVTALRVVANLVARTHADPLRDRAILLDLLAERALQLEALDRTHGDNGSFFAA